MPTLSIKRKKERKEGWKKESKKENREGTGIEVGSAILVIEVMKSQVV